MSRILKRPMFRSGGSTNEGIMHGLVDRKGYADGPTQSEIYAKQYYDQLSKIQPPAPRFNMGQMGLNLVSGNMLARVYFKTLLDQHKILILLLQKKMILDVI